MLFLKLKKTKIWPGKTGSANVNKKCGNLFFKGVVRTFFEGDPYITYRVPKCVSDD